MWPAQPLSRKEHAELEALCVPPDRTVSCMHILSYGNDLQHWWWNADAQVWNDEERRFRYAPAELARNTWRYLTTA